jgi:putative transposase
MAKIEHYYTRFEEGKFYHVYNRTVDKQPMFKNEENKHFFLERLKFFVDDVVLIYAYSLLENHFHLVIRIPDDLTAYRLKNKIQSSVSTHAVVSKQFRRFFQSYALRFNNQQDRCGTLFQTPFKRAWIKDQEYLTHLIYYVHTNAQKHGLVEDFKNWDWNSYHKIMAEDNTDIQKEIISWFGNTTGYINFHSPRVNDFDNL